MSALTSPAAEKTAFPECEPQGLGSPLFSSSEDFGLGGMADSTYEYLPKQHVLLGGLVPQYKKMYEAAIKAANKYLLFRPMLPDNPDIYILGSAMAREQPDEPGNLVLSAEQTHLMCFAGGMYGIGAKIFERKDDLEIAEKLTNGCVWSYEAMQTGIMPERFMTIPCKSLDGCAWNETYWKEVLDPYREAREQQQALWKAAAEAEGAEAAAQPKAPAAPESADGPSLAKRQLGDIENDRAIAATEYGESIKAGEKRKSILESTPSLTSSYPSYPDHESFVNTKIQANNLPIGIPEIADRRYILRYKSCWLSVTIIPC
jgi:mannosyl-oligosaccharide alpha-1,2-mannosidase